MSEPWPRFTPTMARLKSDYMEMREEHFGFSDLYAEEWDRAQAEHDRQVAERAWDEGHLIHGEDYRHPHLCREGGGCIAENPYRAAKGEQK